MKITRTEFLQLVKNALAGIGIAAVVGPIIGYFYPQKLEMEPEEPVLAIEEKNLPQGKSITVPFGRYPALLIHTVQGFKAYSAVCTHFACVTKWDEALGQIVCPCHEGYFDALDGHVISGPPPVVLKPLPVEVVDGDIYIGAKE